MSDDLPPNVTPISRHDRESRGTRSRHTLADAEGKCTHAKPDDWFCHRPSHQHPGQCHLRAGWGTNHVGTGPCKQHGGRLPGVEQAGAEELVRRRATRELTQINTVPVPVDNPLQALADLAGEAVRWKDVLGAYVSELGTLRYSVENEDGSRTEQIRGEVVLYERALASLGRLLVAIGRLNIDDRLARIDERLTDIVVRAVDAGLTEAGVQPDDMDRVRFAVGDVLRRLSA
jgi:hypothetical protein